MRLPSSPQNYTANAAESSTRQRIHQFGSLGTTTMEAVGFWTAVSLPVPTLLLLAVGTGTPTELFAVAGLLTANLLAFYLGHDYRSGDR